MQILHIRRYRNLEKKIWFTFCLILSLMCFCVSSFSRSEAAGLQDEPHISLEVRNQPLGNVLQTITLDTGITFRLSDQWSAHPVNASFSNKPLHQGLKKILKGLNHAIVYESDKHVRIVVYGKVNARETGPIPIQPFSTRFQGEQPEPAQSSEPPAEEAGDAKSEDGSSGETDTSETGEDNRTENEDARKSEEEKSSQASATAADKGSDQGSSNESGADKEQDVTEKNTEDASPEKPSEDTSGLPQG